MDGNSLNEERRRLSPGALDILDSPPEPRFDKFTALAAAAFGTPIALVSFVDAERQWIKSHFGFDTCETPSSVAFCSHAIESDDTMVVPDASLDTRFQGNPLVVGPPNIRFYAGHPIKTTAGYRVGALCIIDTKPRSLTADQRQMLRSLAQMVETELNGKELVAARERAELSLIELNTQLETRVTQRIVELEEKNDALSREIARRLEIETTLRRSEERVRSSEERLRTITNNVPVLISYLDSNLHYQFANAMYKEWLGMRSEDMIGRSIKQVLGDSYFEERKPSLERALGGAMSNVELKVSRKGHDRILSTTYIPHHRDGKVVGIYVLATDATASRQHERQLLALANADPLTGLPNRRMYEFNLAKALATNRRQKSGLALMYLDLDGFKQINDSFGHSTGDNVLVEFGKRIKPILRETDMLARLAGDEFTITLEAVTTLESCELVAKKILDALARPFMIASQRLAVSASIGVVFAGEQSSFQSLSHQADLALYSAKRSGKNRFSIVSEAAPARPTAPRMESPVVPGTA
jgi:diguanylate cyclase (GGDEF)-like protein/PAS domain S-box-containing protein